jgi:cystathionine beta-lyase/cystathionine gamma-synthase
MRMSVGLEEPELLLADIRRALDTLPPMATPLFSRT